MSFMHIFQENDMRQDKRRLRTILLMLMVAAIPLFAQMPQVPHMNNGFNPQAFKAHLERFIAVEACLTPKEAAQFFPLYDEMNRKQRGLYDQIRDLKRMKPADEEQCKKVIADIDRLDLEIKQLQSNYHSRFLTIIPASKLFDVIRAESRFHRQAMRDAAKFHRR